MNILVLIPLLALTSSASQQDELTPKTIRLIDVDADGRPDRLELGRDGSVAVALNRGARQFEPVVQNLPQVVVSQVLAEDLNGDGHTDLFLVSPEENSVLLGDGTGRFVDAADQLGLSDAAVGVGAEWLDIDADGAADILLHNEEGDVIFWGLRGGAYARDPSTPASTANLGHSGTSGLPPLALLAPPAAIEPLAEIPFCATMIEDASSDACLLADSTPTLGRLYPLGLELNIDTAGHVGIGTLNPSRMLDVAGRVRSRAEGFEFPDGTIQTTAHLQGPPIDPSAAPEPTGAIGTIEFSGLNCPMLTIPIFALDHRVISSATSTGGGGAVVRPTFGDIAVDVGINRCTVALIAAAVQGQFVPEATLRVEDLTVTLTDVLIVGVETLSLEGPLARERLLLAFQVIGWSYGAEGSPAVDSSWDLGTNSGIGMVPQNPIFVLPDQDPIMPDEWEILALQHSVVWPRQADGMLPDRVEIESLRLVHAFNELLPLEFYSAVSGDSSPLITVRLDRFSAAHGEDRSYHEVELQNAIATSMSVERRIDGGVVAIVDLSFEQITWRVTVDGVLTEITFDVAAGTTGIQAEPFGDRVRMVVE
jgi:type VI protein secretion system component Hcp